MGFSVFISYSTKDLEVAKQIEQELSQTQGLSVFLSDSSLIVGQLDVVLINKIKQCDLFLLLYSKNSQDSKYVQQEIGVAKGTNKIIIPLLLDEEAKPDAMLQGISYLSIFDHEKKNEQMLRLYKYIAQESHKKENNQTLLLLGIVMLLGYLLIKE